MRIAYQPSGAFTSRLICQLYIYCSSALIYNWNPVSQSAHWRWTYQLACTLMWNLSANTVPNTLALSACHPSIAGPVKVNENSSQLCPSTNVVDICQKYVRDLIDQTRWPHYLATTSYMPNKSHTFSLVIILQPFNI